MNLEANNRSFFPNTWSHWLYNGGQRSPLIPIANTSATSIWRQLQHMYSSMRKVESRQ